MIRLASASLLIFILAGFYVEPLATSGDQSTFTGYISDKNCGRNVDAACSKRCFDLGVAPVLVLDQSSEVVEIEAPGPFRAHPGAHVRVEGSIVDHRLHALSLTVLNEPPPAPAHTTDAAQQEGAIRFPNGQAFVRLPLEILANGPFVQVKVNGKEPLNFEVDTGSMDSPFASELAGEVGLDAHAEGQRAEVMLSEGLTVPLDASFVSFANLWPLTGRRTYGAIGYAVLRHFVVEFDYENSTLTFYDPLKYLYSGPGVSLPASLEMGYDPQIEGEIVVAGAAPIRTRFTLDTGAGGTIISAPLVKSHDLLRRVTQKVPNPSSKRLPDGVNGLVFETVTGRIDAIRLGPYTVDRPLVALSTDTRGVFARDDLGVNLGGNILRRFKVIVDYPHQRVILEPNRHFRDPFPADASGLVLKAEGSDFKTVVVHGIVPGSPADASGLKEGDIITAIDGQPVGNYALWQVQDLLKESNRKRRLTISRGQHTTTVTINLHSLA
jgi:hypothetical protein